MDASSSSSSWRYTKVVFLKVVESLSQYFTRLQFLGSVFARSTQSRSVGLDNVASGPVPSLDTSSNLLALGQFGKEASDKGITLQNEIIKQETLVSIFCFLSDTVTLLTYSTVGINQLFLWQNINRI